MMHFQVADGGVVESRVSASGASMALSIQLRLPGRWCSKSGYCHPAHHRRCFL